jgi:hypothetical protein
MKESNPPRHVSNEELAEWEDAHQDRRNGPKAPNAPRAAPARFTLVRCGEIQPLDADEDYCVKNLLPRSGLVVVWGAPKCGKSFWTFDLLMHVALGWPYRGLRVRQGPVVYVCLEGTRGFRKRKEAFRIAKMNGEDPPFFLVSNPLALVKDVKTLLADIKRQTGEHAPAVLCIDTLNRSITGSENKDEDMGAYIRAADAIRAAFDCLVVIIHHAPHDGARPRGHSSLIGALDVQIAVRKEGDIVVAELELAKDMEVGLRFASRLERMELARDADGEPIASLVVREAEGGFKTSAPRQKKLPPAAQITLKALYDAVGDLGEIPPASNHIPPGAKTVSLDIWRDRAVAMGLSNGEDRAQRKAFQRGTEILIAAGKAAIWANKAWPA